ncbi:glycosyltransferase family 2 protein [Photobacterium sp. TLY01]|uniref:glycosyltransferase family 2 protein n=1 Tax=Photobacterium sp. TLY01 TaxID=2907534 RepID=UPI001F2AC763|nr:glycosyltransferase family 2 protein [Photobacterium sp. TLY01]UIP27204.1 glycosyltransferase family 2 protein [Photobacterium sp. TLY01]
MRVIISVVSHGHEDLIIKIGTLKRLASLDNVRVVCRDNCPTSKLETYCNEINVIYVKNDKRLGFAANNNLNFLYYLNEFGHQVDDYYLMLNPDVIIDEENFDNYCYQLSKSRSQILTANLFVDKNFKIQDHNIRHYPSFGSFISSYLLNRNNTLVKRTNNQLPKGQAYWCSGAFLGIRVEDYILLGGMDEYFYLYCEDIDFCRRARLLNINVDMVENSFAVHLRQRDSQKFFSKYFFWHVISVLKYSMTHVAVKPRQSSIEKYQNQKILNRSITRLDRQGR